MNRKVLCSFVILVIFSVSGCGKSPDDIKTFEEFVAFFYQVLIDGDESKYRQLFLADALQRADFRSDGSEESKCTYSAISSQELSPRFENAEEYIAFDVKAFNKTSVALNSSTNSGKAKIIGYKVWQAGGVCDVHFLLEHGEAVSVYNAVITDRGVKMLPNWDKRSDKTIGIIPEHRYKGKYGDSFFLGE